MQSFEIIRRKIITEQKTALLRALVIATAVLGGAGIGLLWGDASSFHGLVRIGALGSLAGSVALLLTHPKTS
ncbi:hypothetical protein [Paracidovorax valerianellae]|uniref:Uncharacterized protein n=1 Tax=Paracidovorax valerianellae TaxID=187868 RepID=A0A1G7F729_9BURK|nr:hypothetical protein [Paracidovorax valerianellae]MDA8445621.1 hypothetical protein [Paracidovorax valerianellae]SDE71395.1 hypothetical protein SAMN05192589_1277 [Paracidovorax valerianellae]